MGASVDGVDLELYAGYVGYVVILADAMVMLYGLREKVRTRMNILSHLPTLCLGCIVKLALKSAIHLAVCGALVFSAVSREYSRRRDPPRCPPAYSCPMITFNP
jgi:hypothetical protein